MEISTMATRDDETVADLLGRGRRDANRAYPRPRRPGPERGSATDSV